VDGTRKPYSHGATGAVTYHRNFEKQNPYRLLPVVPPFGETTVLLVIPFQR
jgi:hypothetical protein